MGTSFVLGIVMVPMGGFAMRDASPEVLQIEVGSRGDANTLEQGFALAGCLPGTTQLDVGTGPTLMYEPASIQRVGKCNVDDGDHVEPVFFFQAESIQALDHWLSTGKLSAAHGDVSTLEVFRHGAVLAVATDYASWSALADTDFRKLYVKN